MDDNTPKDGKTGTAATADALVQDVNRLKQDVAQLTADAKAHGNAYVDKAKQSVTDAKRRVNDAVANAQAQLAAHPFAILGIGLVLGFLFGRRGRRRRYRAE
jgi:ElaB/YqjD/DUF883 family membrane-anchored ribosome-binding protein